MTVLIMTAQLILALAILVTLHEWGHYIAARAFGIKVEKFYLFFDAWGIKLFKFKKGDTEYGIGWLPLGGYVKIAGMIDESVDKEQLKKPAEPWEFRSKPRWQRLIVMLGGIIVNIILGIIIFIFLTFSYGETYTPNDKLEYGIEALKLGEDVGLQDGDHIWGVNGDSVDYFEDLLKPEIIYGENVTLNVTRIGNRVDVKLPEDFIRKFTDYGKDSGFIRMRQPVIVDSVFPGSNAEKAGLVIGDRVIGVNGEETSFFTGFKKVINNNKDKNVLLTILRGSDTITSKAMVDSTGALGFALLTDIPRDTINYNFGESIGRGTKRAFTTLTDNITGFGKVVSGKVDPTKAVQGPIGIAKLFGGKWNWFRFWTLTGMLSLVLAFMNVLPIPALDGGHALFLLIEMITGRELGEKFLMVMQVIGMVILLGLMILIFGNDIYGLF